MEYLMTYGWAILIIAVVLSVLFQLGVFSSGNFQPHAQAGACQVSRTAAGVSLEGQCNGLLPQYVGNFCNSCGFVIPRTAHTATAGSFSLSWWFLVNQGSTASMYDDELLSARTPTDGTFDMQLCTVGAPCGSEPGLHGDIGTGCGNNSCWLSNVVNYQFSYLANTWYHIVVTFSPTTWTIYVNGAEANSGSYPTNTPSLLDSNDNLYVLGTTGSNAMTGQIANLQLYNATLSSAEAQALYLEGIGGAPIRPQNLTGWWPLNGNLNDYSGYGDNGQSSTIDFSSAWESSYTAP